MMTASLLRFSDVTLGYDRHPAVHHLTGEIAPGSLLAVVGPNGAGKSTLLKGIAGALLPLSGTIERRGLKSGEIAYLPQAAEIDRSFPISVYDFVAMGLWRRSGMLGAIGRADRARIETAIAAVGLVGFERRGIGSLSGGQMQRVLFARLLLQDARAILLDEPFTAIDSRTTADLLALIARWQGEERTTIAVLHDHELVRSHFPDCLVLAREVVAWGRTADVLTPQTLLEARRMVEAWDADAQACAA
jgi:zinc/manganese transport system ATP-binding protein